MALVVLVAILAMGAMVETYLLTAQVAVAVAAAVVAGLTAQTCSPAGVGALGYLDKVRPG